MKKQNITRLLILPILFAVLISYPINLSSQPFGDDLTGKSVVLHFTDKQVSSVITGIEYLEVGGELVGMWKLLDETFEYFQDEDLLDYRMATIDGKTIISNIYKPHELGVILIREYFRFLKIGFTDVLSTFIIGAQPTQSRTENFFTSFHHNGVDYFISLRIRINKYNIAGTYYHYVIIDQAKVLPEDLPSMFGSSGGIQVEVAIGFGDNEFFNNSGASFRNTLWWKNYGGITFTPFTSPGFQLARRFEQNLWDYLYQQPIDVKIILTDKDRSVFTFPWNISEQQIGVIQFFNGTSQTPPKPPALHVISNQSSLTLELISTENVDSYKIYKSTNPDFSLENAEVIQSSENSYEDHDVSAGTTYYYRAKAVHGGLGSSVSEQASGMPFTKYIMELNVPSAIVQENESFVIPGLLTNVDNEAVADAVISVSMPHNNYSFKTLTTDSKGEFVFINRAPTKKGFYDYKFSIGDNTSGIERIINLEVASRSERGRDIAIDDLIINSEIQQAGKNINTTVSISNNGNATEFGSKINYNLRSEGGNIVHSHQAGLSSLSANSTISLQQNILIPTEIPAGNYQLEITTTPDIGKDELMADNKVVKTIYVVDDFVSPVFRTQNYMFTEETTCLTIDGVSVCLEDVNHIEEKTSVVFRVGNELTPNLNLSATEDIKWITSAGDFILLPKYYNQFDTLFSLGFRAGKTQTSYQINPAVNAVKPGYWGDFVVQAPSGRIIDLNSFTFKFGGDASQMADWQQISTYSSNQNVAQLSLKMPANASLNKLYQSYLVWDDQQFRLFKNLKVKYAPIRDIALNNITISNGFNEYLPGDSIMISGNIINYGQIRENQLIELSIWRNDTIVFSDFTDIPVNAGQTRAFQFVWSTIGQELGNYIIKVSSPNFEDEDPGNNYFETQIELVETPLLQIQIIDNGNVYEIGENATISAIIKKEDGTIINDADVLLTVLQPNNVSIQRGMNYNAGNERYQSAGIKLNTGGNYHYSLETVHPRYKPARAHSLFQTFVDIYVDIPYTHTSLLNPIPVNIAVSNVGDIAGIAGDLIFNTSHLKLISASETGFMSNGSEDPVSFIYQDSGGGIVFGLTRLQAGKWGAITTKKTNIINYALIPKEEGESNITAIDFGLISSRGIQMQTRIVKSSEKVITDVPSVTLRIEPDNKVSYQHAADTAGIFLLNGYTVSGISGELVFDAEHIEIIDIWEEDVLNEDGETNTIFQKVIDNTKGVVTFGLTRTGLNDPGVKTMVGRVLGFSYKSLTIDESTVQLVNTGIISTVDNYSIPHSTMANTIVSEEMPQVNTKVFFEPEENNIEVDSIFEIKLHVKNVTNVSSYVADFYFNPHKLELIEIIEGDFLNENGSFSTSFMHHVNQGNIHAAISRLGANDGLSTENSENLLTIRFRRITSDTTEVLILNSNLLKPDGYTQILHNTSDAIIISSDIFNLQLISNPVNGGFTSGGGSYSHGSEVTIKAEANEGYKFVNWADAGAEVSSDEIYDYIMPARNVELTANFEPVVYNLTYHLDGGTNHENNPESVTIVDLPVILENANKEGSIFEGWYYNDDFTGTPVFEITEIGHIELWAKFVPAYILSISSSGKGSTMPAIGEHYHSEGTFVDLYASPSFGYTFEKWIVGSEEYLTQHVPIIITTDITATAYFVETPETQLALNVNIVGQGATIPPEGNHFYTEDSEASLTATPAPGWQFEKWVVEGEDIIDNPTSITMNNEKVAEAHFTELPYGQYSLNLIILGNGSVEVNGEAYKSVISVERGTVLNLQAIPDSGWQLDKWSGDLVSSNSSVSITIDADKTIAVTFIESPSVQYILTILIEGYGIVEVEGGQYTTPLSFPEGVSININAIANDEWIFSHWSGDHSSEISNETITIDGDKSILATFTQITNLEKILLSEIELFPNPFSGQIFLRNAESVIRVEIKDILGRTIKIIDPFDSQHKTINFEKPKAGIYIVILYGNNRERIIRKIVKESH